MENLEVICRVCLKINDNPLNLSSIFEQSSDLDLVEKIFLISGVYIDIYSDEKNFMPKNICYECKNSINSAYLIRETCIKSEQFLQDINTVEFNSVINDDKISKKDSEIEIEVEVDNAADAVIDEYGEEFYLDEFIMEKPSDEKMEVTADEAPPQQIKVNPRSACYICAKLISRRNMSLHLKIHESNDQNFLCDHCNHSFKTKSYLASHILNVHAVDKKFQCEICSKSYSKKTTFDQHKKTHTGSNLHNFKCQICHKSFASNNRLKAHLKTHEDIRSFQCDYENCTRTYKYQTDLKRHIMRQHTLERPYK